jgi:membrane protease YdiL (CAAX protease family)
MRDTSGARIPTSARAQTWILFAGLIGLLVYPLIVGGFLERFPHMHAYLVEGQHQYSGWFIGYIVVVEWLAFVGVYWGLSRAGKGLDAIGFPLRWRWWQALSCALLAGGLILGAVLVGVQSLGKTTTIPIVPVTVAERILAVLLVAPTAAVVEETIFRGFALTYLPSVLWQRQWLAWLVAAALFVLMHGWQAPLYVTGSRFVVALFFSALAVWNQSLKLPMILHWLIDASTALVPVA